LKYLKIGSYELYALAILAFAVGLRVFLIAMGWPPTDSDEGTMGIMARHIAYRGEHPYVFYGQNYMGTIEAHIAAVFFHLFGPSLFTLRLSVIVFVTLFLISTYLLASLLYSKKVALVTLVILSFGSIYVLTRETLATGGSMQTLLFGSLAFLLAAWLSFTYSRGTNIHTKLLRFVGYTFWGLVLGLGFWSDMIVLPFFAGAVLLMVIFCWRDLLWAWIGVIVGFLVGAYPVLSYSLKADNGQNVLITLFGLFHGSATQAPHGLHQILHAVKGTVLVSIPTATGYPFCPVMEQSFLSDNTVQTPLCTLGHAAWGIGYVALLAVALLLIIRMLWVLWSSGNFTMKDVDKRQTIVRYVSQLMLPGSGALAILAYALSSAPMGWPGYHSRYIIGLLIITPALIAPVWNAASTANGLSWARRATTRVHPYYDDPSKSLSYHSRGGPLWSPWSLVLALIGIVYLAGTIMLFTEVPATQAANQRHADLINYLVKTGHTHIYTEYWTCDRIAFESNERILCGVLDANFQPSHNRAPGYYDIVHADSQAAYVFPVSNLPGSPSISLVEKMLATSKQKYARTTVGGYAVYQPISS